MRLSSSPPDGKKAACLKAGPSSLIFSAARESFILRLVFLFLFSTEKCFCSLCLDQGPLFYPFLFKNGPVTPEKMIVRLSFLTGRCLL